VTITKEVIPSSEPHKSNREMIFRFAMALLFATFLLGVPCAAQTVTGLHIFTGGSDGAGPAAPVTADQKGNLFGTTWNGGLQSCDGGAGCGTIFKETAPSTSGGKWIFTRLYEFTGGNDGCCNSSTLAIDREGRLYGVTNGGLPGGSVFQLTPRGSKSTLRLLYTFSNKADGDFPFTPLVIDKSGALYSASFYWGLPGCLYNDGCGTVVQLVPPMSKDGAWTENTLYQFRGGTDGGNPSSALVPGSNGILYGSTASGGRVTQNCPNGCGVVFEVAPPGLGGSWTERVLYTFQDAPDGAFPYALVADKSGALYGLACCHGRSSENNIFKLTPQKNGTWQKTVIHDFSNSSAYPPSYITFGGNGILYGTIFGDIDLDAGRVFQLTPPGKSGGVWKFRTLYDFNQGGPSRNPNGVILGKFGALFGTLNGGDSDFGAVFELELNKFGDVP